ncbi:asparagine synthase B [Arenimonas oryziterrae]|uniref:asparagine synthase (glutamine-hydrolyzing) n=1 Tax=Arenimonas oryziterrae DSM 21050 = YC6267 TaxID=1121015 RepID=A0A091AZB8_9GAMM|nr:asparagine synthase B [Arenimonas oryziterrae]KFN44796.1 asparagine synthetase B [Arenimonas oryziterrae DSM 21050 = YC6267]
MCSILGIFALGADTDLAALRPQALAQSARQRHRGPDWSGVYVDEHALLVHERLAIVGVASGAQPLRSEDGGLALAVNGEIYNHRELRQELHARYAFQTDSDCEVINALYREKGADFLGELNGIFAFALWDAVEKRYLIARDPLGVCPLYTGHDAQGRLHVASEMKALVGVCDDIAVFPPGHYLDSRVGTPVRYWSRDWRDYEATRGVEVGPKSLRSALESAVHRQLMTDVPYGVLLSGGLDSSLVAACAAQFARHRIETDDREEAWWPRLHSFAIGLEGSPDLAAARVAADSLGTSHHEFKFTIQEGLDALPDVIRHIETYDVTSIRASTPMYLMARRIKAMGVKMVLSGEGADEIFGGYLYFHKAPSAEAFHEETVRKLDALHLYDCNRANKAMAAWGVEARVPFLDLEFLDVAMSMDAEHKRVRAGRIEKAVLRQAFDGALPDRILWRQKEQFSDGVGYGWIDSLKAHAEATIDEAELAVAAEQFPHNPPMTKEALMYRRLFAVAFPSDACAATVPGGPSIACSTAAAIEWDAAFKNAADPSGRAVAGVHLSAT